MTEKGFITSPGYSNAFEDSKIEFFRKIKNKKLDAISVIYKDTSPTVVQQAALFITKLNRPGHSTSLPGIVRADHYAMSAYEYIKEGDDWIVYLNFKVDMKQGVEFTKLNQFIRLAVARINGVNYLAYEGSDKVFVVENGFAGSFGAINLDEFNDFMDKQKEKNPYKLSNINEAAYLADAPEQLFGDDTVYYRDGDNLGFWISFGTLIKIDSIDFNNINIDGVKVALIDTSLPKEEQFKRMLNAKAAGYACVIFKEEDMLKYLLEKAKEYVLTNKKEGLNKVCLEDLLRNVSQKGLLGIVYQKVESLQEMYLPAFDYTTASVKEIVGKAICFIYDDEYIWMHYDKDNKEIDFMSYKGDMYTFSDKNVSVTMAPNPTLSKVNKVNDKNFVLFTGFKNLEVNNVLDIYFDGKSEILNSKNKKYAIDVTAFDDYYKQATSSFNAEYNGKKELIKTYGTNKYPLITGLVHYEGAWSSKKEPVYKLSVETFATVSSLIDVVDKKAHLNAPMIANYGYLHQGGFKAQRDNFVFFAQNLIKNNWSKIPSGLFYCSIVSTLFQNGYFTLKDGDKFVTLKAERDIYYSFSMFDMMQKLFKRAEQLLEVYQKEGKKPKVDDIVSALYGEYYLQAHAQEQAQAMSLKSEVSKKIKVCSDKERWEFHKVSDNMYVNNKPTSEICNHAVLFEDAFYRASKEIVQEPQKNFYSQYIQMGHLKEAEDKFVLDVKSDLSDKSEVFIAPDMGIKLVNIPKDVDTIKYMKFDPKVLVKNNGIKKIKDEKYNIFLIQFGYKFKVDTAQIIKDSSNMYDGSPVSPNIKDYSGLIAKAKEERDTAVENSSSPRVKKSMNSKLFKKKIEASIDNSFVPVGLEVMVAYKSGKILVSIGGEEFYEPYVTDNGLRLNYNMYISNIESFERELRNMMLSDVFFNKYNAIKTEEHIVSLQQVKVKKILVNKDMSMGYAIFTMQDIPAVVNGILYQPGEEIVYGFDLDIDIDYINQETGKRVVFWDIVIEYQTLYPINAKNKITNPEEITQNDNCFTVKHHIPITVALDGDNYIYEKKSQAVDDGVFMFVNFTKGDK